MAEVAGLVLAVAPLIISTFEHYEGVARYCQTFAKYTHRIKAHLRALNVQETIFRNATERLLCHCTEEEQARQMLLDRNHAGWHDSHIAALYWERLGGTRSAFEDCIETIADELATIKEKLERLEIKADESGKNFRKRIKYAFKEANIEAGLGVLREKTQDLITLVNLSEPRVPQRADRSGISLTQKEVDRYSRINMTAANLYQALGHACTKHTDHQVHLSLETVHSDAAQIQFTLAFSRLSIGSLASQMNNSTKSAWLTVESSISGRLEPSLEQDSLLKTQLSLKRALDDKPPDKKLRKQCKLVRKSVHFELPPEVGKVVKPVSMIPSPSDLENLCARNNFCDRLQKFVTAAQPCKEAIGFLHLSGESKHLLYIDSKAQLITHGLAPSALTSLFNVLKNEPRDDASEFSLRSRIGLARQLATAILQFQSTPWLGETWRSQKVLISRNQQDAKASDISQAFISAQIEGPNSSLERAQSLPSPLIVRNRLLFGLGVMLLELAFQKPLVEMIKDSDMDATHTGNTEFLTADRLSRQVSSHMGPRYAEVTKKCIHCYFASGNNLKQPKLQAEFYQDVVCELEKLEGMLKGL